jgi:high-affinity nickel-transport protein
MLTAAALGFALGLRHAADPDHVAAIAALVARQPRPRAAVRLGAIWGLGHSLAIVAAGGALVALRIERAPAWTIAAEAAVAVILVALGVANLRGRPAARVRARAARHESASIPALRSLGIGVAHGLAGSAAVALLALAAMPGPREALAYLAVFSLGTIGGMTALSLGLGLPASLAGGRPRWPRRVEAASGAVSVAVGLALGIGLLAAAPPS